MQIVEMLFAPPVSKAPLIQPTRYYVKKGLKAGYFVVVLEYDDLPSHAKIIARELQKRGISCSILRIY
jgi:hypothetical protein